MTDFSDRKSDAFDKFAKITFREGNEPSTHWQLADRLGFVDAKVKGEMS